MRPFFAWLSEPELHYIIDILTLSCHCLHCLVIRTRLTPILKTSLCRFIGHGAPWRKQLEPAVPRLGPVMDKSWQWKIWNNWKSLRRDFQRKHSYLFFLFVLFFLAWGTSVFYQSYQLHQSIQTWAEGRWQGSSSQKWRMRKNIAVTLCKESGKWTCAALSG